MAEAVAVTCPECEKKFKPKTDVRGKKIKCPFCTSPFVVPGEKAAKADKGKPDPQKKDKAKPEAAKEEVAATEQKPNEYGEFDNDPNPYGVKHVALVPRCPNCTEEMGEHDTICLACGYNTLTRVWGKTEKTLGLTFGRHIKYLLPAIGSAVFTVFAVFFLIFYCTVAPFLLAKDPLLVFLDDESMRMWTTVIVLGWIFGAGGFCFKKFIDQPKPDEITLE